MMKRVFLGLMVAGVVVWDAGAISVPSAVRPPAMKAKSARFAVPRSFAAGLDANEARVTLAPLDMGAVAAQDAVRAVSGEKSLRIGMARKLAECVTVAGADGGAGVWTALDDGSHVWRLTFDVRGALGVRVQLSDVRLPTGCELLVFDADDPSSVRGPYTAASLDGRSTFWAGTVFSESMTVECYAPRGIDPDGVALKVKQVAHIYREPDMVLKEGSCHNDVSCYPAWAAAADGVAGVGAFYDDDFIFCTGCLLNDLDDSTWVDFFLTANHCVVNQNEASDAEFYWFFQKSSCSGGVPSISSAIVTGGGAELLASRSYQRGSDFSLLRLRTPSPDGAMFNGWETAAPSYSETLACIHHPDSTHKRISFANLTDSDADFWAVTFYNGATEPGSSGSPLFNRNRQVIGQLSGGISSCEEGGGFDVFGRFDAMFPFVSSWLARGAGTLQPAVNPPYGSYSGLMYGDRSFANGRAYPDVSGALTLTASKTGRVTAKAVMQEQTLSFQNATWAGSDSDGWFYVTLRAKGGETLELYADWFWAGGVLSGGSLGSEEHQVEVTYNVFGDRKDSAAQADLALLRGYYTMALPVVDRVARGPAKEVPGGSGYLTLTVGNNGGVKIAGKLSDGTAVSQSAKLLLFGDYGTEVCVPLFRPLYLKKGMVSGLLWIDPGTRTVWTDWAADWYVRWDKPGSGGDGFEALLAPCGGYYNKGAALAASYRLSAELSAVPYYAAGLAVAPQQAAFPVWVDMAVAGGRLAPAKGVKPVEVDGVYDYSEENSACATFTFSALTGIYKGGFSLYYDYTENGRLAHKAVKATHAGVMTQTRAARFNGLPAGLGYYLVPDTDPAFGNLRLKRSFGMDVHAAP